MGSCKAHRPITRERCVLRDGHDGTHRTVAAPALDVLAWGGKCGNRNGSLTCHREKGHLTPHCGNRGGPGDWTEWPNTAAAVLDASRCPAIHPESTPSDPFRCEKGKDHDSPHTCVVSPVHGAPPLAWEGCGVGVFSATTGDEVFCGRRAGHDGAHRSGGYSWGGEVTVGVGADRRKAMEERVGRGTPPAPTTEPIRLADRVALRANVWKAAVEGTLETVDSAQIAHTYYTSIGRPEGAAYPMPPEFRSGVVEAVHPGNIVAVRHDTGDVHLWAAEAVIPWTKEDAAADPGTPRTAFESDDESFRRRRKAKIMGDVLTVTNDEDPTGLHRGAIAVCPFKVGMKVRLRATYDANTVQVSRVFHDGTAWRFTGVILRGEREPATPQRDLYVEDYQEVTGGTSPR